jgi:DNA-binding transcriptional LysR family regulator
MELRQLEYFVSVADEESFTRAARRVHISQSGVSAQIQRLERDVGATLIDRSARRATLTSAGRAALPRARAALSAVNAIRNAVDEVTGVVRGRLSIGMVVGCQVRPLFDALAAFHRDHPGVELEVGESRSDRLIEDVRARQLDLALVATAGDPPADLDGITIVSDRLVVAIPTRHPLAARARVRLRDLAPFPLVCLPHGTGIRGALDAACAMKDVAVDVVFEANSPDTVAALASRGLGVGVLSESTVTERNGALRVAKLEDVTTRTVLAVVWPTTPDPALAQLVACLERAFCDRSV